MKILLIAPNYGFPKNISVSFIFAQAKTFQKKGHEICVIIPLPHNRRPDQPNTSLGNKAYKAIVEGISLFYVSYYSFSNVGERLRINQHSAAKRALWFIHSYEPIKDYKPDIVLAHTLGICSYSAYIIGKELGIPVVTTTHGSDTIVHYDLHHFNYLKLTAKKAGTLVCVSSVLESYLKKVCRSTNTRVILNGFVPPTIYDIPKKDHFHSILFVGHLIPQKKADVLIKAFAKIHNKYPDSILTIIGRGPDYDELRKLVQELSLELSVSFCGELPHETVLDYMVKNQFFILPSIKEGFGIVYLEAMACGCVAIGTMNEGISDFICDGVNGYLIPPNDSEAIFQLIDNCFQDRQKVYLISENGYYDAKKMTWDYNVEQYIGLFNILINGATVYER